MSNMFDMSQKFSKNMSCLISCVFASASAADKKANQIQKSELKACQLIRCSVGSLYHMEAKAKLTLIHNVVNGVVFLLVNIKT